MSPPYRARPGAGLVALVITSLSVTLFLAWGFATPTLDEVWRMQIEMGLGGGRPLRTHEFQLLQATLRRHPALADNMLEDGHSGVVSLNQGGVVDVGYAYLVRKEPGSPAKLHVKAISDKVALIVRTLNGSARGEAGPSADYTWRVPNDGPFPQLVEVRLTGSSVVSLTP